VPILLLVIWFIGVPLIQAAILPKLVYDLPPGYIGWATVQLEKPSCKSIKRGHALVYEIDATGQGCTSDPLETGWRTVVYEYVRADGTRTKLPNTGWGKGGMIWGDSYRVQGENKSFIFFVGTEQQFGNEGQKTDPR